MLYLLLFTVSFRTFLGCPAHKSNTHSSLTLTFPSVAGGWIVRTPPTLPAQHPAAARLCGRLVGQVFPSGVDSKKKHQRDRKIITSICCMTRNTTPMINTTTRLIIIYGFAKAENITWPYHTVCHAGVCVGANSFKFSKNNQT